MIKPDILAQITELGIPDTGGFVEKCARLQAMLRRENEIHNLTRITSDDDFWIKHIYDSAAILRAVPELASGIRIRIGDIGCGAGFPSIVLACAFPSIQVTAIDSNGKKAEFVAKASAELGLANLKAVKGRARELSARPEWQGRFDIVTARAVAASQEICKETRKMLASGGRFVFYKTPSQAAEEMKVLPLLAGGYSWTTGPAFELPLGMGSRIFVIGSAPSTQ